MPTATIGNSADLKRVSLRGWFACAFISVLLVFAYAFLLDSSEAQAKSGGGGGGDHTKTADPKGGGNGAKGDGNGAKSGDLTKTADSKGGGSTDNGPSGVKDTTNSTPNTNPDQGGAPSGHETNTDPVGSTTDGTKTTDPVSGTTDGTTTTTPAAGGETPPTTTPDLGGVTPPITTPAPGGVTPPITTPVGGSIITGQLTPEIAMPSSSSTESVSKPILTPSSVEFLPHSTNSEFASEPVSIQVTKPANEGPDVAAPIATQLKAAFGSLAATMMHSVDRLLSPNFGLLTNLLTHTNDQTSGILEWLSGVLGGNEQTSGVLEWLSGVVGGALEGGNAPSPPVNTPFTPTPVAPPPPAPAAASFTSNFFNGAKHSDQDYLMLFGVLALLSIPLMEGMFSLHYRELFKPSSLPHLAIERPG